MKILKKNVKRDVKRDVKRKFFFDHIYKAAGSTIDRLFVDRLGMECCTTGLVEPATAALLRYAEKAYVTGHFSFSPQNEFDSQRYNFTLLRHPVDRLISHYFFSRNDVGPRGGDATVELAKKLDLGKYYESNVPEILNLSTNFQARHYARLEWDGTEPLDDKKILSLAKKALHRYDLVGVFHKLEEFSEVLFADAGWGLPPELPMVNKTSKRPRHADIPKQVEAKLSAINRLDIELYDYAAGLFDAARRKTLRRLAREAAAFGEALPGKGRGNDDISTASGLKLIPKEYGSRKVEIQSVNLLGEMSPSNELLSGENVLLRIDLKAHAACDSLAIGIRIQDTAGKILFGATTRSLGKSLTISQPGSFLVEFAFRNDLGYGRYSITVAAHSTRALPEEIYHWKDAAAWFLVTGNRGYYFDGAFKMYPQVSIESAGACQETSVGVEEPEAWPGAMHISTHNPPLNGIYSRIRPCRTLSTLMAQENMVLECEVVNTGTEAWPSFGNRPVKITYHWKTLGGEDIEFDGLRTNLPGDLAAGGMLKIWLNIRAPMTPGPAVLHLAVVQEYAGWSECDNPILLEILPL